MMRVLTNKEKKLVQIQKTFYWYIFHMSSSISDIYFSEMHHLKKNKKNVPITDILIQFLMRASL